MAILVAMLIGSIVFLSALLIGMALMLRKQWEPENTRPGDSDMHSGGPRRRQ